MNVDSPAMRLARLLTNAWSDEARAAALAARKASHSAHKVTESLADWMPDHDLNARLTKHEVIRSSKEATKNAGLALKAGREGNAALAREYHKDSAASHDDAAENHRLAGPDIRHEEAAKFHERAARLNRKAMAAYS